MKILLVNYWFVLAMRELQMLSYYTRFPASTVDGLLSTISTSKTLGGTYAKVLSTAEIVALLTPVA